MHMSSQLKYCNQFQSIQVFDISSLSLSLSLCMCVCVPEYANLAITQAHAV